MLELANRTTQLSQAADWASSCKRLTCYGCIAASAHSKSQFYNSLSAHTRQPAATEEPKRKAEKRASPANNIERSLEPVVLFHHLISSQLISCAVLLIFCSHWPPTFGEPARTGKIEAHITREPIWLSM